MNTITFPISLATSTSSWTLTFQAEARLNTPPPTWPAVRQRLIEAEYQRGTTEGNRRWHRALRDAILDLRITLTGPSSARAVVERIQDVQGQFLDAPIQHLWVLLALRSITSTPALRETLLTWLGRTWASDARVRNRLTTWAYEFPRVGMRLATDDRFWRSAGHDPYTRWGRVLDNDAQQKARLWSSWELSEQRQVQRSPADIRRWGLRAAQQVRLVQGMECSGLLERDRDEAWVDTWLNQALEWGALARVRAVLDHGKRLDGRSTYQVNEALTHVLRGTLFDPDPIPCTLADGRSDGTTGDTGPMRYAALEQRKLALWRALRAAGLNSPALDLLSTETLHGGQGNGPVWRDLALEARLWTPSLVRAFLTLQLKGWDRSTADGHTPIGWAAAHRARGSVWSREAVIAALQTSGTAERGQSVDVMLTELVRIGVRWSGPDRTPEGVVAQAVRYGASADGLAQMVVLRADFLWRGNGGESVLMRTLATGARAPMVEALLYHAVRRHGPVGGHLLRRTDQGGATALHWAARAQEPASVRLLLDRGLRATDLDRQGRTTVHWAVRQVSAAQRRPTRLVRVVELLVMHGANPLAVHARGRSAMDELVDRGPPGALLPLLLPHVDRLHEMGRDGTWAQRLRERGEPVTEVLETLELHHTADGAMLGPAQAHRTVRRL